MRRLPLILLLLLLPAAAHAQTAAVRAQVEKTMNAFTALDPAAFGAGLADDVTGYELDLEEKPVHIASKKEAMQFAESMLAALKQADAKLRIEYDAIDCHAVSTLAYCTIEFKIAGTVGGKEMSEPWRNTIALRKERGAWKWTHWHSSLAK